MIKLSEIRSLLRGHYQAPGHEDDPAYLLNLMLFKGQPFERGLTIHPSRPQAEKVLSWVSRRSLTDFYREYLTVCVLTNQIAYRPHCMGAVDNGNGLRGVAMEQAVARQCQQCPQCGGWCVGRAMIDVAGDGNRCPNCIARSYRWCAFHNLYHRAGRLCIEMLEGRVPGAQTVTFAQNGNSVWHEDTPLIRPYGDDVLNHLKGFRHTKEEEKRLPADPLWLGVELEAEPRREANCRYVRTVHDTVKEFAILKHDGSLGPGGIEIVTVPATLEYHRQAWLPFFEKAASSLWSWETGRCGIHVHINRHHLTDLTAGKMLMFVNMPYNRKFIEKIAGRGAGHFSEVSPKKIGDGKRGRRSHYDALSFSQKNHGKTMELRIFRGNVEKQGLFRYLEFTVALVEFCKITTANKPNGNDFLDWFRRPENYSRFPYLARWMRKNRASPQDETMMLNLRSKFNPKWENEKEAA